MLTDRDRLAFMRLWRCAFAGLSKTLRHLYDGKQVACLDIALPCMITMQLVGKLAVLALQVELE